MTQSLKKVIMKKRWLLCETVFRHVRFGKIFNVEMNSRFRRVVSQKKVRNPYWAGSRILYVAHSSSGLGRRPLKAEITGSNPVCATNK